MRLGSRLLLPLLVVVAAVMTAYGAWALRQRQTVLAEEARRETRAYATALGISLEQAFRDPDLRDVQAIINRISRERQIYGVLVYGADGRTLFASDPLPAGSTAPPALLGRVLATGRVTEFERHIEDEHVYSVLHPIPGPSGRVVAAFEVAQPLASLRAEAARVRQRFVLNTLTLLVAVTVLILWLVRRLIARPLERLVAAVQALGRGEPAHRLTPDPGGGELAELAREFNRMVEHLESARAGLIREGEERLLLERRLRQTEKLAAVGNLAAGLAHEVAAPLHVIRGRAELLLRREPEPETRERNLRIIVEQIGRITLVVQNLLDYARRREPRIERTDLGRVVDGVAEFLEGEFARAGVEVAREGAAGAEVDGDPHLLHQVFINLFMNAVQAMEGTEGRRRITVRLAEGAEGDPGEVRVEVEDTGPGVPPEALPRIFEPFFTTKTGGEGTGLGLAVVRGIVEEHGGRIEAGPAPSGGARFRIAFPAPAEATRA
ncbi:MAG TPA: HAMP domain-containing sensor histidine kinase [Longimicrobiaceae bacterium]